MEWVEMTNNQQNQVIETSTCPRVELGTVMLVTFSRSSKPIKAMYVGTEPGNYIILRFPAGAGVHDFLFEGNEAVAKYLSDGTVYGFRTEVIGYLFKKRLILVVMACPDAVESHSLRKEHRVDFLVPAVVHADGFQTQGFILDISNNGCRFAAEGDKEKIAAHFGENKKVVLSTQLLGLEGSRNMGCVIKSAAVEENRLKLGLEFEQVEEAITRGIQEYVAQVSRFLEK
jgi:c-di-GMP-binding flagellar brake protein YcgR